MHGSRVVFFDPELPDLYMANCARFIRIKEELGETAATDVGTVKLTSCCLRNVHSAEFPPTKIQVNFFSAVTFVLKGSGPP